MDKQMKKNKYFFGLGTIGRDALYSLVSMYLLNHLTDVVGLGEGALAAAGVLLTLFGIFDAVIDPFVGIVVDNTKSKWGKFKPWMFVGMIGTGILTVLMFHNFPISDGWHVALLAVTYLLFSIFFSANDISYWSLMPAISKDPKTREQIGAFARICANVGMFAMVIIYTNVPSMFSFISDDPRQVYFVFAIITAVIMWAFQSFTIFGVKEDKTVVVEQEKTTLRDMFRVLWKNDQLMIAAVAMALFMIGYCTTTAFGLYYFKYAYKDEGVYMVFAAVLAVAQLTALSVFPFFRKKFTRRQLYFGSMVGVVFAYIVFFLSFEWLPLIVLAGLVLFFSQAFIQLLMLLFLADAVEYGEWKLGRRNEAVSFAVQPFVNQIGGAMSKGVVSLTLIVSGLHAITEAVADAKGDTAKIDALVQSTPDSAVWIMKIAMMIFPLICILVGFIIYQRKFKIDEKFYDEIVSELAARNAAAEACVGAEGEGCVEGAEQQAPLTVSAEMPKGEADA